MTLRLVVLAAVVVIAALAGLLLGARPLVGAAFTEAVDGHGAFARLVWEWRLPRVVTALLVGACLGVAGAVFQGVFRNPLAEPYLLGSASGAALGAAVAILLPGLLPPGLGLPLLAFLGAWGATWLVVVVAELAGVRDGNGLLLAGVALAAVLAAGKNLLMLAASDEVVSLKAVMAWNLGGIQTPAWGEVPGMALLALAVLVLACRCARGLDLLGLGDESAACRGLAVARFRAGAALVAAAATALAVAWGGVVGFVGLIAPHCMRWWLGPEHRWLLPASAACGAAVVALMDGLARALLPPAEIPLGLLTALVGGPFFLLVLVREARR